MVVWVNIKSNGIKTRCQWTDSNKITHLIATILIILRKIICPKWSKNTKLGRIGRRWVHLYTREMSPQSTTSIGRPKLWDMMFWANKLSICLMDNKSSLCLLLTRLECNTAYPRLCHKIKQTTRKELSQTFRSTRLLKIMCFSMTDNRIISLVMRQLVFRVIKIILLRTMLAAQSWIGRTDSFRNKTIRIFSGC